MDSHALRVDGPTEASTCPDFDTLFETEFNYVWNSLRRLGVPRRDLEDLTHDVFLRVIRQWARYDRSRPIRPWLFAFAVRVASDYRRLARHRVEFFDIDPDYDTSVAPTPSALDRMLCIESLSFAQRALDSLDLERRAVFILHELDGYNMPDVARALGIPLNTAYSRLRLAREQFNVTFARLQVRRGVL
jgi:RNA polymerase sigma-70 factor, ECF subfamily